MKLYVGKHVQNKETETGQRISGKEGGIRLHFGDNTS